MQSNLKPEQCRLGKHTLHERRQTQCCWDTESTPLTCQWYLFAVFLPPHSMTKQVNLSKWSPSPPCVRAEIRHWRDLQTEEAKIKKRELLWKWQEQQIKTWLLALTKHWKGPIDLEKKYKLEQGTIWKWTDPTHLSTAPEKFLDIFYYYHFLIFLILSSLLLL